MSTNVKLFSEEAGYNCIYFLLFILQVDGQSALLHNVAFLDLPDMDPISDDGIWSFGDFGPAHEEVQKVSMTSLLPHTVAQPTKWRFLPKNLSQLVIFVIELAFT